MGFGYFAWTIASAWLLTVLIKIILNGFDIKKGFSNGGMPSSHTGTIISVTAGILFFEGWTSLFALSVVMSIIVITDAFRRHKGSEILVGGVLGLLSAILFAIIFGL